MADTNHCLTCRGAGWLDASGPGHSADSRNGRAECSDCSGTGERSHCEVCHTNTRQCDPLFGEDGQCLWCESERMFAAHEKRRAS
jgi:hypothetical protein